MNSTAAKVARPIYIANGTVLQNDELVRADLWTDNGRIATAKVDGDALRLNAEGLLVLPGIIDVHGDAFERSIMPRASVSFELDLAFQDTDQQLAANGITTAYHGLTISWEPGLRSLDNAKKFMAALAAERCKFRVDHRVQLRWETFAFDAVEDVAAWLAQKPTPALAFNDHTTSTIERVESGNLTKLAGWASRCGLTPDEYVSMVYRMAERRAEVPAAVAELAAQAKQSGAVILSHDDVTKENRAYYRDWGADISEFPMTLEALHDANSHGEHAVFGAPNVVRGGSHNGSLNAADMAEQELCTILASDYHYPSLINAAFALTKRKNMSLAQSWALISKNPAAAMHLTDRGTLDAGHRADIILVREQDGLPQVVATLSKGELAYLADGNLLK